MSGGINTNAPHSYTVICAPSIDQRVCPVYSYRVAEVPLFRMVTGTGMEVDLLGYVRNARDHMCTHWYLPSYSYM